MLPTHQALERTDVFNSSDLFQNKLHLQRYEFALQNISPNQSALEVGTGVGAFSQMLKGRIARYAGVEIDPEACRQAGLRIGNADLIKQGDAHEIPFESSSFDVVVCFEVLEHLKDFRKALGEIRRVLRPSGKLIASIPYRKKGGSGDTNPFYGRNPFHLYEPGEAEFHDALAINFLQITLFYQIFRESTLLNLARRLKLRRLLGLVEPYRQLTAGHPAALDLIAIEQRKSGLALALLAIAELPRS
jgi:SAM-dependent methyltransferase